MVINYSIKISKRKSISIQIEKNGDVIVKAPKRVSKKFINDFIISKKDWVEKNVKKVLESRKNVKKEFKDGEIFMYLGSKIELKLIDKKFKFVKFDEINFFISKENSKNAKTLLYRFYRKKAKEVITDRVNFYVDKHNFKINNLKISSAKTRWGSCSFKNNININWKLIFADTSIMDYVIIHELSHTIEHNHSKNFWNFVEKIIPDYKEKRLWLKKNGGSLDFE